MPLLFIAHSKSLAAWGGEVGLGKFLFKAGCDAGEAATDKAALKAQLAALATALSAEGHGGQRDWQVLAVAPLPDGIDEAAVLDRLGRKEKPVDPAYYPAIRGAAGIYKLKPDAVANSMMIQAALEDKAIPTAKPKPADFAAYLIRNAIG